MAGNQQDGHRDESLSLGQGLRAAMMELLAAHQYAIDARRDPWDFSLKIHELQALGLKENDFRWLICKQFVRHAREITLPADPRRAFRPEGGLTFSKRTCFIISDEGIAFARRLLAEVASPQTPSLPGGPHHSPTDLPAGNGSAPAIARPHWDPQRRELRLDGHLVKRFRVPSPNQESILHAFEEEGWPARVDDPLSPEPEQNPKRRLNDTIKSLNQHHQATVLRFRADGCSEGVCWELTPEIPPSTPETLD
jgi:hypothetical protein